MKEYIKKVVLGIFLIFPSLASAHVRYFDQSSQGVDASYLFSALKEPFNIFLIAITLLVVGSLVWFIPRFSFYDKFISYLNVKSGSYEPFLNWLVRLPLGIALIGFGTHGVLLTPILETSQLFSLIQTVLGFMILVGFGTSAAGLGVIVLYIIGLSNTLFLIGSMDIFVLAFSLLIISERAPSLDDLFSIRFPLLSSLYSYLPRIFQVGFGTGLLYLALDEKLLNPHMASLVVNETGLNSLIPVSVAMWVLSAGIIEAVIGLLLIAGWRPRLVSAIAFVVLTLSFFYFKEDVYPHVTLFGTLAIIFLFPQLSKKQ